jgi:hypothetical protein
VDDGAGVRARRVDRAVQRQLARRPPLAVEHRAVGEGADDDVGGLDLVVGDAGRRDRERAAVDARADVAGGQVEQPRVRQHAAEAGDLVADAGSTHR